MLSEQTVQTAKNLYFGCILFSIYNRRGKNLWQSFPSSS